MKYALVYFFILWEISFTLNTTFKRINFNPALFQLTFSSKIPLPSFQILVSNKHLQYQILTTDTISSSYQIQITSDLHQIDAQNTQSFSLVFNYPMDIQNGTLYLGDYVLIPQKNSFYLQTSSWPALLIFILLIISSIPGIIGNSVIDFMQIYILTELKFNHSTSFVVQLSKIFFFDENDNFQGEYYILGLALPSLIIVMCYLFGRMIKFVAKFISNTIIMKRIVKFCAYDLFFTIWLIQLPSVLFSALDFINDTRTNSISLSPFQHTLAISITYLNFINIIIFLYFLYFILNPTYHHTIESFKSYLQSQQFKLYSKLHTALHLLNWTKRNILFFMSLRKFIIITLYFYVDNISPYVLSSQFIVLFFLFTFRPYKQEFYTYSSIVFTLVWFFYFIVVLEGYLYFNMQQSTLQTNFSMQTYLITKTSLFLIICFIGFLFAVYQNYIIIKNIKYQIQQEVETQNNYLPGVINRNRLYTETSDKAAAEMKQSLIFEHDAGHTQKRQKDLTKNNNVIIKGKISLFEIEMDEMSSPVRKRKTINQSNKIWKDKSLFQQLATAN